MFLFKWLTGFRQLKGNRPYCFHAVDGAPRFIQGNKAWNTKYRPLRKFESCSSLYFITWHPCWFCSIWLQETQESSFKICQVHCAQWLLQSTGIFTDLRRNKRVELERDSNRNISISIGRLSKIEKLSVCQSLKYVPKELPSLTCLSELNLHNCRQLDMPNLHNLLDALRSVRKLILDECCNFSRVPCNIKHLWCLEYLSLRDCTGLRFIPQLPPSAEHLDAINCTSLETVLPLMPLRQPGQNDISISFENCLKLDEHSKYGITEYANFTMKHVAYANDSGSHHLNKRGGAVCFPGSKVPEWFENRTTTPACVTVQLPPPSHLLGFAFCVVLSQFQSNAKYEYHQIVCRWCLEDGKSVGYIRRWYYKAIRELNSDHVYVWYEPSCEKIIDILSDRH